MGFFKDGCKKCIKIIDVIDCVEEIRNLSQDELRSRDNSRKEHLILAVKEESFWRHRVRISWLKDGDRNTNFFHKMTSYHKCSNEINGCWFNRVWTQNLEDIRKEMQTYSMKLFKEEVPLRPFLDGVEFDKISEVEKRRVERSFLKEEVHLAIMNMKGEKSLGPDGFTILFF